jgi:hypothetical protein
LFAEGPRDFWSLRWHSMFNESFKELGYYPLRNLCINLRITSRKFCNDMGILGAYLISSFLHEYFIIGMFNMITGEHLVFFLLNGLIMIVWERVFTSERENKMKESKEEAYDFKKYAGVYLKRLLWLAIFLLILPALSEPMLRRIDLWIIPSFITDVRYIYKNLI